MLERGMLVKDSCLYNYTHNNIELTKHTLFTHIYAFTHTQTSIKNIVKLCPTTTPMSVKMRFHKKDTRI